MFRLDRTFPLRFRLNTLAPTIRRLAAQYGAEDIRREARVLVSTYRE